MLLESGETSDIVLDVLIGSSSPGSQERITNPEDAQRRPEAN